MFSPQERRRGEQQGTLPRVVVLLNTKSPRTPPWGYGQAVLPGGRCSDHDTAQTQPLAKPQLHPNLCSSEISESAPLELPLKILCLPCILSKQALISGMSLGQEEQ